MTRPPSRIVAIGDLNGADNALQVILLGTRLVDSRGRWAGGRAHLVQVGDLFNRGSGGRAALQRLMRLQREARSVGGDVTVLLGNHEVMTALRHEGYCTEGEYLSFATAAQRAAWPARAKRAFDRIATDHAPRGPIPPYQPRWEKWKAENVPGRVALRRAFGPKGSVGRVVRRLPVALRLGEHVFVHGGLSPAWARHGIEGLERLRRAAWREGPVFVRELSRDSILRAADGPLWNRVLARGPAARTRSELQQVLRLLEARRLVVGHTPTALVPGGKRGRIALRAGTRLACLDVGLWEGDPNRAAALVIRGRLGEEWTPAGRRELWRD